MMPPPCRKARAKGPKRFAFLLSETTDGRVCPGHFCGMNKIDMAKPKLWDRLALHTMVYGGAGVKARIAAFGLSLGFCLALSEEALAFCTRPSDTIEAMRAALQQDKTIKQGKANKDLQLFHTAAPGNIQEMWTFTRPSHPAHPGFSCWKVGPWEGGSAPYRVYAHCKADKAACDRYLAEIHALTAAVIKQWKTD